MRNNNFDKSSSGTDIEFRGFLDTDASRRDFVENIEIVQHDGYRTTSIGYYISGGEIPGPDEIKFTVNGDKAIKLAWVKENGTYNDADADALTEDELNDEIISRCEVTLIDYAMDCVSSRSNRLPNIPRLEFVPNKNLIFTEIRGYSQGDYAIVIYCPEDVQKSWGNMPEQSKMDDMFTHYYYDAPVYAVLEVNGEEYNYWDYDCDPYDWEREKFIKAVSEKSGVPVETLSPLVPKQLDV